MAQSTRPIWGVYPGTHRVHGIDFEDDTLFPVDKCVGVGWHATGDLAPLKCDYSKIYAVIAETHKEFVKDHSPNNPEKWFERSARILHRFVCEAQRGDIVVYACKTRSTVYAGIINREGDSPETNGSYFFSNKHTHWHYKHFRAVTWLKETPYSYCTKHELAQIRTQNIFWTMKNCPAKFIEGLQG